MFRELWSHHVASLDVDMFTDALVGKQVQNIEFAAFFSAPHAELAKSMIIGAARIKVGDILIARHPLTRVVRVHARVNVGGLYVA